MWDGFNQRKFPRLKLQCEITLEPQSAKKAIIANTENVGAGGVCLIQNEPLERFSHCHVRLKLGSQNHGVECDGKVAWIIPMKADTGKNAYDTGIEFVGLSREDRKRISSFIEEQIEQGFRDIL